jgi:hypothetical protein
MWRETARCASYSEGSPPVHDSCPVSPHTHVGSDGSPPLAEPWIMPERLAVFHEYREASPLPQAPGKSLPDAR